jgi:hypothetical protein
VKTSGEVSDLLIFDVCHKVRSKVRFRKLLFRYLKLRKRKKTLAR